MAFPQDNCFEEVNLCKVMNALPSHTAGGSGTSGESPGSDSCGGT